MEKATTVAVIRPASPSQMLLPKIPGMYMKPMSWSIRGVPRTIQTKVLHSQRRGVSRLMEPKAITSPKGRANSSVKNKICIVVPKPLSRVKVTFQNRVNASSDVQ